MLRDVLIALAATLSACSSLTPTPPKAPAPMSIPSQNAADLPKTHVLISDSPYYRNGPQQARPSDGTFSAGTEVTLLQNNGSYSIVQSAEGVTGHVATAALQPIE